MAQEGNVDDEDLLLSGGEGQDVVVHEEDYEELLRGDQSVGACEEEGEDSLVINNGESFSDDADDEQGRRHAPTPSPCRTMEEPDSTTNSAPEPKRARPSSTSKEPTAAEAGAAPERRRPAAASTSAAARDPPSAKSHPAAKAIRAVNRRRGARWPAPQRISPTNLPNRNLFSPPPRQRGANRAEHMLPPPHWSPPHRGPTGFRRPPPPPPPPTISAPPPARWPQPPSRPAAPCFPPPPLDPPSNELEYQEIVVEEPLEEPEVIDLTDSDQEEEEAAAPTALGEVVVPPASTYMTMGDWMQHHHQVVRDEIAERPDPVPSALLRGMVDERAVAAATGAATGAPGNARRKNARLPLLRGKKVKVFLARLGTSWTEDHMRDILMSRFPDIVSIDFDAENRHATVLCGGEGEANGLVAAMLKLTPGDPAWGVQAHSPQFI